MSQIDEIVSRARISDGYEEASRLLQLRDQDWVIQTVGRSPRRIADLGCGIGSLLEAATIAWPDAEHITGIEPSAERLATATARLRHLGERVAFIQGSLPNLPPLSASCDLITLTAVLHWIHPFEEAAFEWVRLNLADDGVFLFTSHHPAADRSGFGGEDDLVRETFVAMGLHTKDAVPTAFRQAGVIPMGTRTASEPFLRRIVERYFVVDRIDERAAVLKVDDADQYRTFHAATFGTYYSAMVPDGRVAEFFDAIGRIAERRMNSQGYVNDIPVRLWRCVPARPGVGKRESGAVIPTAGRIESWSGSLESAPALGDTQ